MLRKILPRQFSSVSTHRSLNILTSSQKSTYEHEGFIVLKNIIPQSYITSLLQCASELEKCPEVPGKWMKYFEIEKHSGKRQLCRIENFLPYYEDLNKLSSGLINDIASELFGEPAVIYKEKLNFKMPYGNGFRAHQDQSAFITFGGKLFLTALLPIDPNTRESGGLDFAPGSFQKIGVMPRNSDGSIRTDIEAKLNWVPVDANVGDLVFFDSYVPHRSDVNTSLFTRRNLYFTYNPLREGSNRENYFIDKRNAFPPEIERDPNKDYSKAELLYNVANPIK